MVDATKKEPTETQIIRLMNAYPKKVWELMGLKSGDERPSSKELIAMWKNGPSRITQCMDEINAFALENFDEKGRLIPNSEVYNYYNKKNTNTNNVIPNQASASGKPPAQNQTEENTVANQPALSGDSQEETPTSQEVENDAASTTVTSQEGAADNINVNASSPKVELDEFKVYQDILYTWNKVNYPCNDINVGMQVYFHRGVSDDIVNMVNNEKAATGLDGKELLDHITEKYEIEMGLTNSRVRSKYRKSVLEDIETVDNGGLSKFEKHDVLVLAKELVDKENIPLEDALDKVTASEINTGYLKQEHAEQIKNEVKKEKETNSGKKDSKILGGMITDLQKEIGIRNFFGGKSMRKKYQEYTLKRKTEATENTGEQSKTSNNEKTDDATNINTETKDIDEKSQAIINKKTGEIIVIDGGYLNTVEVVASRKEATQEQITTREDLKNALKGDSSKVSNNSSTEVNTKYPKAGYIRRQGDSFSNITQQNRDNSR